MSQLFRSTDTKKDYTRLNKIKKEVSQHLNLKLNINQNSKESSLDLDIPERIEDLVTEIESKVLLSEEELEDSNYLENENTSTPKNKLKHITL